MTAAPTTPNVSQDRAALTGALKVAPLGTAIPIDVSSEWAAGWLDLGLVDDKGVTNSHKKSMNKQMAWQSALPIRQMLKSRDLTYKFVAIQLNWLTRSLWLDAGASTLSGGTYSLVSPAGSGVIEWMFGIEWNDGTYIYREGTHRGLFTDSGDVVYVNGQSVLTDLTYETLPLDLDTEPVWTLTNDPAFASS